MPLKRQRDACGQFTQFERERAVGFREGGLFFLEMVSTVSRDIYTLYIFGKNGPGMTLLPEDRSLAARCPLL